MNKSRFAGKIAVVTGTASPNGIGFATAKLLAEGGAQVILVDIAQTVEGRAEELRQTGYNAVAYTADLTKGLEVKALFDRAKREQGPIDILVNNAGMAILGTEEAFKTVVQTSDEEWDRGINLNLKTTFNCVKAVLPQMIERNYGRIVCTSSVTGPVVSNPGEAAYAAAKAGVMGLIRTLAIETGKNNIIVNAVAPGWIATGASTEGELAGGENTPMGRSGSPEEVGKAIMFLASDDASYITGQMLVVDGGNTIQEYKGPRELYY